MYYLANFENNFLGNAALGIGALGVGGGLAYLATRGKANIGNKVDNFQPVTPKNRKAGVQSELNKPLGGQDSERIRNNVLSPIAEEAFKKYKQTNDPKLKKYYRRVRDIADRSAGNLNDIKNPNSNNLTPDEFFKSDDYNKIKKFIDTDDFSSQLKYIGYF